MLLLQLGLAFILLAALGLYCLYARTKSKVSFKDRLVFIAATYVSGLIVVLLDFRYVKYDPQHISFDYKFEIFDAVMSYTVFASLLVLICLPVLFLLPRFRKYPVMIFSGGLFCFLAYGIFINGLWYVRFTTARECVEKTDIAELRVVPQDTEMHRVFNLPVIDYCIDKETGEPRRG